MLYVKFCSKCSGRAADWAVHLGGDNKHLTEGKGIRLVTHRFSTLSKGKQIIVTQRKDVIQDLEPTILIKL